MHPLVSMVGAVLVIAGAVGWFGEVLPVEHVERVQRWCPSEVCNPDTGDSHCAVPETKPARPVEFHPYSSGIIGGLVGGAAMAVIACAYGVIEYGSLWYPINLLAAVAIPSLATADTAQLAAFHGLAFGVAAISHVAISIFVGLVYAAILPMFPRRPAVLGGVIGPLLWSGLLWSSLGVINPALNARIDWQWFVASQIAFGIAAGAVITRTQRIRTMQSLPFAARAGIEAPGLSETKDDE
jgi:hypothetical protein